VIFCYGNPTKQIHTPTKFDFSDELGSIMGFHCCHGYQKLRAQQAELQSESAYIAWSKSTHFGDMLLVQYKHLSYTQEWGSMIR
jgi:hypothetical protein